MNPDGIFLQWNFERTRGEGARDVSRPLAIGREKICQALGHNAKRLPIQRWYLDVSWWQPGLCNSFWEALGTGLVGRC